MKKMNAKVWIVLAMTVIFMPILGGCVEVETTNGQGDLEVENSIDIATDEFTDEGSAEDNQVVEDSTAETIVYTYTDISATKYAKSSVNVRNQPSTDGDKIGGLSQNEQATVTGQCVETGWYRIEYQGSIGYVSNNYLVDEKIVVEVPEPEQPVAEPSVPDTSQNTDVTTNNNQGGGNTVTVPDHEETVGNLVWVPTNGGKKYHSKSTCSNMENPMQVSVETATANGYTACKRCY